MKAPDQVATLSCRSLSQPTLTRISDDLSDTESVSSAHEIDTRTCFAEVLYSFNPGGPEELPLQKGDLVEVIEKSSGPWWYGKIKHDQVIVGSVKPQHGWFPKDFVEILPHFAKPRVPQQQQHRHRSNKVNNHHNNRKHHHHHHHRRSRSQSVEVQQSSEDDDSDEDEVEEEEEEEETVQVIDVLSPEEKVPSPTNCDTNRVVADVEGSRTSSHHHQHQQQTSETFRENAMRELIEAEVNYVKLLESICVG